MHSLGSEAAARLTEPFLSSRWQITRLISVTSFRRWANRSSVGRLIVRPAKVLPVKTDARTQAMHEQLVERAHDWADGSLALVAREALPRLEDLPLALQLADHKRAADAEAAELLRRAPVVPSHSAVKSKSLGALKLGTKCVFLDRLICDDNLLLKLLLARDGRPEPKMRALGEHHGAPVTVKMYGDLLQLSLAQFFQCIRHSRSPGTRALPVQSREIAQAMVVSCRSSILRQS